MQRDLATLTGSEFSLFSPHRIPAKNREKGINGEKEVEKNMRHITLFVRRVNLPAFSADPKNGDHTRVQNPVSYQ